jgi:hypothetical protein
MPDTMTDLPLFCPACGATPSERSAWNANGEYRCGCGRSAGRRPSNGKRRSGGRSWGSRLRIRPTPRSPGHGAGVLTAAADFAQTNRLETKIARLK